MRKAIVLLASVSLFACNQQPSKVEGAELETVPAAVTYDGAGASDQAALVAHGERLSEVLGCKGCHGETLQGQNFTADAPEWGDHYAKNLSLLIAGYSDSELDQAIRHGRPKDGRSMVFMPSEMFEHLSDSDFRALVAYLRTVKPGGEPQPPSRIGPQVAKWAEENDLDLNVSLHEQWKGRAPVDLEGHAQGRYIARTACTECHNVELQGYVNFAPDLDIAASYDVSEFQRLMREGKAKSNADIGMMAWAAQTRFSALTDGEIAALHSYLTARAGSKRPE